MALPPMAPGGRWLRSGDGTPHYVVHEAHIQRLFMEGWQPTEDPRKETSEQAPEVTPAADSEKEEMKQRIAALEAMLNQALVQKSEPTETGDSDIAAENPEESEKSPRRKR